jgi:hypothetical protein
MKKSILIVIQFFIIFAFSAVYSIEITQISKFSLFQDEEHFISKPGSFFKTEDNIFFIVDNKASDIKIYDNKGNFLKTFGRNGFGPNDFASPMFSGYNKPYIAIFHYGLRHILVYERTGKTDLTYKTKFLCMAGGSDLQINNQLVLVSGYIQENHKNDFSLYTHDYKKSITEYLIPNNKGYGYDSNNQYKIASSNKIVYIGQPLFCDWTDSHIYQVWTGNLNILKFNRKTKGISYFGKKTENYVTPTVSKELRNAYDNRQLSVLRNSHSKMHLIRKLFITKSNKIGVIHVGPLKNSNHIHVFCQLYNQDETFLKEFVLLKTGTSTPYELYFFFDKENNLLYALDTITSKEFEQSFCMHEFRIME